MFTIEDVYTAYALFTTVEIDAVLASAQPSLRLLTAASPRRSPLLLEPRFRPAVLTPVADVPVQGGLDADEAKRRQGPQGPPAATVQFARSSARHHRFTRRPSHMQNPH